MSTAKKNSAIPFSDFSKTAIVSNNGDNAFIFKTPIRAILFTLENNKLHKINEAIQIDASGNQSWQGLDILSAIILVYRNTLRLEKDKRARKVFYQHYVKGYSVEDLADDFKISTRQIYNILAKTRAIFKEELIRFNLLEKTENDGSKNTEKEN